MSNYPDDYNVTNAPDVGHRFINSNGDVVAEAAIEDMEKLVEAALIAANTMLAAAWNLIDSHNLDCARDILSLPYDCIGEWVYCAAGSRNSDALEEDFGIDVSRLERGYPAMMRTRELFKI